MRRELCFLRTLWPRLVLLELPSSVLRKVPAAAPATATAASAAIKYFRLAAAVAALLRLRPAPSSVAETFSSNLVA